MLKLEWTRAGRRWSCGAALCGALALAAVALQFGSTEELHAETTLATSVAGVAAPVDTTIVIRTVGSNLEFMPSQIAVKAGKRVRIRYVNDGTLPHNIVLMKDADEIDMLGMAAFQASKTGYVPLEHKDRMYAYSTLAVPGETVEIEVIAPPPGEYLYVCLYPGHYNMMIGTLRTLP
jgi:uncharacterized cupredoxin-like copper-binding protein